MTAVTALRFLSKPIVNSSLSASGIKQVGDFRLPRTRPWSAQWPPGKARNRHCGSVTPVVRIYLRFCTSERTIDLSRRANRRITTRGKPELGPRKRDFTRRMSWLTSERKGNIAGYALMSAVILVIVVGTLRLIGSNANTAFSSVASTLQ